MPSRAGVHAYEADIAAYDGVSAPGWDRLRANPHGAMRGAGDLRYRRDISPATPPRSRGKTVADRNRDARRMAACAAIITCMDRNIGRGLPQLRVKFMHDDTPILFPSDNGGCGGFMAEDGRAMFMPDVTNDGRPIAMGIRPDLRRGGPLTDQSDDLPGANVSNAPFRVLKHRVQESGSSAPLLVPWPARVAPGGVNHDPWHVVDILPTILDAAGIPWPREFGGHAIHDPDAESFPPALAGRGALRQQSIWWEREGNWAVRVGDFRLLRRHGQPWALYEMNADRTELGDLAGRNAPLEARRQREYHGWAARVGVLDWSVTLPRLLGARQMGDAHG